MSNSISRQQFLQYTAAAGAAMLLSSLEGLALERPEKKLRPDTHSFIRLRNNFYGM